MKKAPFIVIEGVEGAGKSSIIKKLNEVYPDFLFTREPGGSDYGEEIRGVLLGSEHASKSPPMTKLLLFFAARADHLKRKIQPALERAQVVLSDRFDASTYAYQISGERERDLQPLFFKLREKVVGNMAPNLYIYLDVDPEISLPRKQTQENQQEINYFDNETIDFHQRVREGFNNYFKFVKEPSVTIDASQPFEKVLSDVIGAIDNLMMNYK